MDNVEFGKYIKSLRKQRGLTLTEIAKQSGVSHSYLSQIETGKKGIPSPEILYKLTKPLDVDHVHLMFKAGYLPDEDALETEYEMKIKGKHFGTTIEAALTKITKDNQFVPEVKDEIQQIKEYVDLLEDDQELTPDFLRKLVSTADWSQEWIQDVVSLVINISRNYKPIDKELMQFLSQSNITYKNKQLSEDDRKRILSMLDLMFPES